MWKTTLKGEGKWTSAQNDASAVEMGTSLCAHPCVHITVCTSPGAHAPEESERRASLKGPEGWEQSCSALHFSRVFKTFDQ